MASSNRTSVSSIEKLNEEEDLDLLDLLERNGILQCEVAPGNTRYSDKSTSCSTRSSYATVSPTPDDNHYYECFDYADEEKKRPDSDDESTVTTDYDDMVTIEETEARVEREAKNICHRENENESNKTQQKSVIKIEKEKKRRRSFLSFCSATCLLKYLGVLLFLVGVLYAFSIWSFRRLAPVSTFNYVQGPIPIILPCTTMIVNGPFAFVTDFLHKRLPSRKYFLLIFFVLVLSLICSTFCICSLIYLISVIQSSLHQLNGCSFDELDRICSCYGPNHKIFKFAENLGCNAVKDKLKELAYGVSILFGVGCLISVATAAAAILLLYRERRARKYRVEYRRSRLGRGSTTVENELAVENEQQQQHVGVKNENDDDDEIESAFSETHRLAPSHRYHHRYRQDRREASHPAANSSNLSKHYTKRDLKKQNNKHNLKTRQQQQQHHQQQQQQDQQLYKQKQKHSKRTKITSVATQTPNYMIPVSSLMYDVIDPNTEDHHGIENEDTCSELSLDATLSPPSYTEAVKVLKKDKYSR